MTAFQLYAAIGEIDDSVLVNNSRKKSRAWLPAAAAIGAVLAAACVLPALFSGRGTVQTPPPSAVLSGQKETIIMNAGSPVYTLEDAVEQSGVILRGTVAARSEAFEVEHIYNGSTRLFTDYTVRADSVLRGDLTSGAFVTVRIPGGETETKKVVNQSVPDFDVGDSLVLFLYQPHMGGEYNTVGDYWYITCGTEGIYLASESEQLTKADGSKTPSKEFLQRAAALSEQYPTDAYWQYHYNEKRMNNGLKTGEFTQAEYDEFWQRMNTYAKVIINTGD